MRWTKLPRLQFYPSIGVLSQPDYSATQIYLLKKITYPTGGRTEFTYEPNQMRGEFPDNVIVRNTSGLRISNIRFFSDKVTHPPWRKTINME